ncbi:MAG: DUF2760 domain-containing protein, partial [Bryobacteraceae bacterium]
MKRLLLAIRCFFMVLGSGRLSEELARELGLSKPAVPRQERAAPAERRERAIDGALQMLALLQREGRLVDFLMEDISAYTDEQVGAAARSVHEPCRAALLRYLRLAPVIDGVEGTYVKLAAVGAPAAVRFVGNVPVGARPEGGILRHKG